MYQKQNQRLVLDKIADVLDATPETHAEQITARFDRAKRIFVAGAGRSRLVGSFLAMRLMHGGYNVSLVGEIVTPAIQENDLLLIISGSGETEQLIAFARRSQAANADVVLITAKSDTTIGDIADAVFQIGTAERYRPVKGLPMGTTFELSTLCFLEGIIAHIIWEKGVPEEEMRTRHANLE